MIKVIGTVFDKDDNQPVIGASVLYKSSSTITNIEGKFSLTIPALSEIKVSYIGYTPVIVKTENTDINIIVKMEKPTATHTQNTDKEKDNTTNSTYAAAYEKAAEQYRLGNCYYYGKEVAKDLPLAIKYYREAAENGHTDAQYNLGNCYENGTGVTKI